MLKPGETRGHWTVLDSVEGKRDLYRCRCSCGAEKSVRGWNIENGLSRSCGHDNTYRKRHSMLNSSAFPKREHIKQSA